MTLTQPDYLNRPFVKDMTPQETLEDIGQYINRITQPFPEGAAIVANIASEWIRALSLLESDLPKNAMNLAYRCQHRVREEVLPLYQTELTTFMEILTPEVRYALDAECPEFDLMWRDAQYASSRKNAGNAVRIMRKLRYYRHRAEFCAKEMAAAQEHKAILDSLAQSTHRKEEARRAQKSRQTANRARRDNENRERSARSGR